jgi:hypothetical protein
VGRLRRAMTYDQDERGIAYGMRVLWRRRSRSSRPESRPAKEDGKTVPQGEGDQVIGHSTTARYA